MHSEDVRGSTPPPPPLRARASPQHRTHQGRVLAEHLQKGGRGCNEGASRVCRGCGGAVRAGGAGSLAEARCGGAVRREHRVRGGAEAAAERLVVVVVGVVHRVGLSEVGRTAAWGVQQLGGHHLHGQRACTVHALRMRCVHAGHTVCSVQQTRSAPCLHRAHHRAAAAACTAACNTTARAAAATRAATAAEVGQPQPARTGLLEEVLPQVVTLGCHPAARRGRAPGLAPQPWPWPRPSPGPGPSPDRSLSRSRSRTPKAADLWCVEVGLRAVLARGALRECKLAHIDEGLQSLGSRVQHLIDHALHRREQPVPRVVAHGEEHIDAASAWASSARTSGSRGGGGGGWQRCKRVAGALQQGERAAGRARRQWQDSVPVVGKERDARARAGHLALRRHQVRRTDLRRQRGEICASGIAEVARREACRASRAPLEQATHWNRALDARDRVGRTDDWQRARAAQAEGKRRRLEHRELSDQLERAFHVRAPSVLHKPGLERA
eukprot:scaffold91805_cov63-Phaeocystis_antarctica.AAC.3